MLARYRELEEKGFAAEDAAKSAGVSDRKPNTKPAHRCAEYAAEYEHPGYGRIRIGLEQDRLTLGYNKFNTPLDHWHYEVFQAPADRQNDLELTRVQFQTDLERRYRQLDHSDRAERRSDFFHAAAARGNAGAEVFHALAGEYDDGGVPVSIVLRDDNVLQYSVLGNVRELVPVRGTYFRIKDLAGTAVEFLRNAAGKVDRMAIYSAGLREHDRAAEEVGFPVGFRVAGLRRCRELRGESVDSRNFFSELKRRNVYRVGATYAVIGWLVIQIAATIVPALALPPVVAAEAVVLATVARISGQRAVLAPVAFQFTPEGIRREGGCRARCGTMPANCAKAHRAGRRGRMRKAFGDDTQRLALTGSPFAATTARSRSSPTSPTGQARCSREP